MAWRQHIEAELNRLAAAGGSGALHVAAPDGDLSADVVQVDALALAFERLAFRGPRLAGLAIDQLQRVGEQLASRLTYLLEPIGPVEIDRGACLVQLRSKPPAHDDDGTKYYEILIAPGELSLVRYCSPPGQSRTVTPAQVTREVFARLASDFAAAGP